MARFVTVATTRRQTTKDMQFPSAMMASNKQIATALLTEHLRYTPLALIDDIINTVNELTNRAVDGAERGLLAADPAALGFSAKAAAENGKDEEGVDVYPEIRSEIEEGVHQLETLLEANIDKNFDKFEILALRGILSVPQDLVSWIRLAHYEVCDIL
jgi:kinetochore protein Mis12/MTW1